MKVNNATIVEYKYLLKEFQGDKETEVLALIGGVNFTIAFPIVARLNHVIREKKFKNYLDELDFWFGSKSPMTFFYSKQIAAVYNEQELDKLRILNIWSNLTLLQRFLESYQKAGSSNLEDTVDNSTTQDRLFRAYLLINELYVEKFNQQKVIGRLPKGVGVIMMNGLIMTTMLLPYHDLNHIDPADAMISQFVKAVYFFQFAELNLPHALTAFLQKYGVGSWQDYLKSIFPLVDHALKSNREGLGYLVVKSQDPNAHASRLFLTNLSVSSTDTGFSQHDFILPRSKPLMQITADKFLIIDNLLVFNKLYNSLFFEFKEAIKLSSGDSIKGDFKGYLNDYFSESYLTAQVLSRLFVSDKYLKFSGEDIRSVFQKKFKAEPDYYARNNEHVFLFELKDTFINGETKQSFDSDRILKELTAKLWSTEKKKKGKTIIEPKAVKQLQKNIQRLAVNAMPFDDQLEGRALKIYPIVLYLDQSLSTPGINDIVNEWFMSELSKDKELGRVNDRFEIMPLTMIDLDTLIVFQEDISDGTLNLENAIPIYWQYKEGLMALGVQNIYKAINDSALSFGAFVRLNRKKRRTPALFLQFGSLLFKNTEKKDF